jgi:hypothetical protein
MTTTEMVNTQKYPKDLEALTALVHRLRDTHGHNDHVATLRDAYDLEEIWQSVTSRMTGAVDAVAEEADIPMLVDEAYFSPGAELKSLQQSDEEDV